MGSRLGTRANSTGGDGGVNDEQEECREDDTIPEDAPAYVQTALARRRRRVCSCSSQTDYPQHGGHMNSPGTGSDSPTASLSGFNILGR